MSVTESQRQQLVQALGAASRRLVAEQDVEDLDHALTGVLQAAVATVPGAGHAGISLLDQHEQLATRACTHAVVRQYDRWHGELGDGPCLTAIRQQRPVLVTSMTRETQWSGFTERATAHGLDSLLAFPLCRQRHTLGALTLYASHGKRFTQQAQSLGELFATHVAVALFGAVPKRQLNPALAIRDAIGQAKGILMHREDITGMDAFSLLLHIAQQSQTSLAEVAGWIVDEHEHPDQGIYPSTSGASSVGDPEGSAPPND